MEELVSLEGDTATSTRRLDATTLAALKSEVDGNACAYLEQLAEALYLKTGVAASKATIYLGLRQLGTSRKLVRARCESAPVGPAHGR